MRLVILAFCGIQIVLASIILVEAYTISSDPAGAAMAQGMATIGALIAAIFLVPALIMALSNIALKVALVLSLIPIGLFVLAIGF
jgi:hypothetical protein